LNVNKIWKLIVRKYIVNNAE